MPNHCTNRFRFSGSRTDIARLKALLVVRPDPDDAAHAGESPVIDFNRVIPMPSDLQISEGSESQLSLTLFTLPETALLKDCTNKFYPYQTDALQQVLSPLCDWNQLTVADTIKLLAADPQRQQQCRINIELGRTCANNIRLYGHPTWYGWSIEHWGTKWNDYHCTMDDNADENSLSGYFDTAWAPPEPIYHKIAALFPCIQIEVQYIDEGGFFAGTYLSDGNGQLIDIVCNDDDFRIFAETQFGWVFDDEEDEDEDEEQENNEGKCKEPHKEQKPVQVEESEPSHAARTISMCMPLTQIIHNHLPDDAGILKQPLVLNH